MWSIFSTKRKESEEESDSEDELIENEHHVEIGDENAVKHFLDDMTKEFFQEQKKYKIHYGWDNMKLLMMVLSALISPITYFYRTNMIPDYVIVYTCVSIFFALQGLIFLYAMFIESDIILRMTTKDLQGQILVRSSFADGDGNYTLRIISPNKTVKVLKDIIHVGKVFDAEGYFAKDVYMNVLQVTLQQFEKSIPIGKKE